jgi:integrase
MTLREAVRTKRINIIQSPLEGVKPPKREKKVLSLGDKIGKTQGLIKWMIVNEHPDYCRFLFQWLGLRRSERLGLQWSAVKNLNGKNPKIVISHQLARYADGGGYYLKKPKTPSSIREIPLAEPFLSALKDWKKVQDEYKKSPKWKTQEQFSDLVFLTPTGGLITQNHDNEDWRKILSEYLGEDDPQWRGHLNRHVCATLLAQNGVKESVAKKVLGHSSEAMTSYYTSVTTASLREPLAEYGKVLTQRVKS